MKSDFGHGLIVRRFDDGDRVVLAPARDELRAHPNWQTGFSVVYLEPVSGRFHWYPIEIRKGFVWRRWEYEI